MAGKKEKKNSMLKNIISSMMPGKMMGKAVSSAAKGMKDMMSKKMSFKGGAESGGIRRVKLPSPAKDITTNNLSVTKDPNWKPKKGPWTK